MEKSAEKANFATEVSRLSENVKDCFRKSTPFLLKRECVKQIVFFLIFYHLAHQRDVGNDLTLEN